MNINKKIALLMLLAIGSRNVMGAVGHEVEMASQPEAQSGENSGPWQERAMQVRDFLQKQSGIANKGFIDYIAGTKDKTLSKPSSVSDNVNDPVMNPMNSNGMPQDEPLSNAESISLGNSSSTAPVEPLPNDSMSNVARNTYNYLTKDAYGSLKSSIKNARQAVQSRVLSKKVTPEVAAEPSEGGNPMNPANLVVAQPVDDNLMKSVNAHATQTPTIAGQIRESAQELINNGTQYHFGLRSYENSPKGQSVLAARDQAMNQKKQDQEYTDVVVSQIEKRVMQDTSEHPTEAYYLSKASVYDPNGQKYSRTKTPTANQIFSNNIDTL